MKKWFILFVILVFPYLIVQVVEKATHNILTLGYLETKELLLDSLGNAFPTSIFQNGGVDNIDEDNSLVIWVWVI